MAGSFASRSLMNAVAGGATTVAGFLTSVLVARLLGVEGTGVVAFATWVITVAILVSDLGVPGTLARYMPDLIAQDRAPEADGLAASMLRAFLLVLLAVLLAFGAGVAYLHVAEGRGFTAVSLANYKSDPLFWVLVGAACVTQGLAAFVNGLLRGKQDYGRLAKIAVLSVLLQLAAIVAGALLFGITGALFAAILGSVPAVLALPFLIRRRAPFPPEMRGRVWSFALASWGGYVLSAFAASRMEIFFLERSWGSEAVGIFAVALTLSNLATQGPVLLSGALLPYLSQLRGQGDHARTRDVYAASIRMMALLVFPSCLGLAAVAAQLLPLLFGQDFAPAVPTTVILVAAASFGAAAAVSSSFLFAMEAARFTLLTGAIGAVLTVAVGLTLVPAYGPVAAAYGRGGIQIVTTLMTVVYIRYALGCPTPYRALARLMASAMACGGVAYAIMLALPVPAALLLAIPAGALAYAVALRLTGAVPAEDLARIGRLRAMLPGPAGRALMRGVAFLRH